MKKKKNKSGRDGGRRVYALLSTAPDVQPALEDLLRENNGGEITTVSNVDELLRLMRKGTLAWAVLDKLPPSGFTELLVSAATPPPSAGDEPAPRILLLSSAVWPLPALTTGPVHVLHHQADKSALQEHLFPTEADEPDEDLPPSAFFALLATTREEAWIRVNAERRIGDLCIRGGKAIYAEAGTETGDSAALRILGWSGCSYEYRDLPSFLRSNMDWPLADLIARVRPDTSAKPEPAPASSPREQEAQSPASQAGEATPGPAVSPFDFDPLPEPEPPVFQTSLVEIRNTEVVTEEPTELLALLEVTSGFSSDTITPAPETPALAVPAETDHPVPLSSTGPSLEGALDEAVSSEAGRSIPPVLNTPTSEIHTSPEAVGVSPDEPPTPLEAPSTSATGETESLAPPPETALPPQKSEPENVPAAVAVSEPPTSEPPVSEPAAEPAAEPVASAPAPEPAQAVSPQTHATAPETLLPHPVEAATPEPAVTLAPAQAEPEPESEELELVGVGVARQEAHATAEARSIAEAGTLDLGTIEAANGLAGLARISEPPPPAGAHPGTVDLPRKTVVESRVPSPPAPPPSDFHSEPPAARQAAPPEPPAVPALTAEQHHAVQHALAELARDCRPMMGATLISSTTGEVAGSFYREGKPLDVDMILTVWRAFRPIGERQQLGQDRHVALAGAEATILIAAVRETDYLLVIHLAGAYPFWPIEHPVADCERELRHQLGPHDPA